MQRGFVSFFSGALGLDLGLEQAGLKPLALNEKEKWAVATVRKMRPDVPLFACDVRRLDAEWVLRTCGEGPFAVVGGPPCQSFSTAGRREGLEGARGSATLHFLDLACALKPEFIVVENVRGLLTARASRVGPSGSALRQIVGALESRGYGVSFQLYDVAGFGVPQSRERLVLIARRGGARAPHLAPSLSPGEWRTFRDAVEGLEEPGACAQFRAGRERFFAALGPGQNWRDLPQEMRREALGRAYDSTGGRVGFCRRIAWDKPAPTLVTCPTMPATELGHPEEMRPLSVNEYKRVQTFPDEWDVQGPLAAQYRQIGNAVPVMFGRAIGEHLLACAAGAPPARQAVRTSRYLRTDDASWRLRYA